MMPASRRSPHSISHPGLRRVSRIKGRTHVSTRPRATPLLKISLAPKGASTHVANSETGHRRGASASFSRFVRDGKPEAIGQQLVLLAHGPGAGEAEALAQPQHGLEVLDGAPRRVERAKAPNPRHRPLTRKWSLSIPC